MQIENLINKSTDTKNTDTTGVPAMIGASLVLSGQWKKPGVYNVEEFDPDPYMEALNKFGLPWVVDENPVTVE